jgi:hypothetical protein
MEMSHERLRPLVDHLEDSYFEILALRGVLNAYTGFQLPSWAEISILVAEMKRNLRENGQGSSEPFPALWQRIREEPNLDQAIQLLVEHLPRQ